LILITVIVLLAGALGWGLRGVLGGFLGALAPGMMVGTVLAIGMKPEHPETFVLIITIASGSCGIIPYAKFLNWIITTPEKFIKGVVGYVGVSCLWGLIMGAAVSVLFKGAWDAEIIFIPAFVSGVIGFFASYALKYFVIKGHPYPWKMLEFISGVGVFASLPYILQQTSVSARVTNENAAMIILVIVLLTPVITTIRRVLNDWTVQVDIVFSLLYAIGIVGSWFCKVMPMELNPILAITWYTYVADLKHAATDPNARPIRMAFLALWFVTIIFTVMLVILRR